jgi:hypothetical protein
LQQAAVSSHEVQTGFIQMIESPLEAFMRRCQKFTKEKTYERNHVLVFLDALWKINAILPDYGDCLHSDEHVEKMLDLRRQFTAALKVALAQYKDYLSTYVHKKQKSKGAYNDGSIYSLTVDTLNFLKSLSEYKEVLDSVDLAMITDEVDFADAPSVTASITVSVLMSLEDNLTLHSTRLNKINALSALFLLNNYHFILKSVETNRLEVDAVFSQRYNALVKSFRDDYEDQSWSKALGFVNSSEAKAISNQITEKQNVPSKLKNAIKSKLKGFNECFDKLYETQRNFSVPDAELRSQLRNKNASLVVPKYQLFITLFEHVEFSSKTTQYIKYSVGVLRSMLAKLFDDSN